MDILNNTTDLDFFFSSLSKINDRILMLDYDGTLSPFTSERNKAYPYTGIEERLNTIIDAGNCRVIIITGRTIEDLLKLIHFRSTPEIWGSHGLEQLTPDGTYSKIPLECGIKEGLKAYEDALRLNNLLKYCEMKASSIAVHWRGCSTSEINDINTKIAAISTRIKNKDILVSDFDGGKEIRIRSVNKGVAVNKVMVDSAEPFVAAYLGDDLTDEDAFKQLGQRGLKVLVRKVLRDTLADIWLEPPDELIWFLKKWEKTCRNKKPA